MTGSVRSAISSPRRPLEALRYAMPSLVGPEHPPRRQSIPSQLSSTPCPPMDVDTDTAETGAPQAGLRLSAEAVHDELKRCTPDDVTIVTMKLPLPPDLRYTYNEVNGTIMVVLEGESKRCLLCHIEMCEKKIVLFNSLPPDTAFAETFSVIFSALDIEHDDTWKWSNAPGVRLFLDVASASFI